MSQLIGDLQAVETDILVWGTNQEEHDKYLMAVLGRCEKINLTLNQEKCQLSVPRVSYIGHILSADGVQLDPKNVKAIQEMPPPTDKEGIVGTTNYLAKFIPNMSTVIQPI